MRIHHQRAHAIVVFTCMLFEADETGKMEYCEHLRSTSGHEQCLITFFNSYQ